MNKPCFYNKRAIFRALPVLGNPLKYILLRERKRERVQSCFLKLFIYYLFCRGEEEDVQRVLFKKRRRQLQMERNIKPFPLSRSETGISSKHN